MRLRDVAELVRLPAALTVPGDSLAGAVAAGWPYGRRTWAAPAASACLYLAGMALNDFADADLDARERPERPIPSGRVDAFQALGLAAGLTGADLGLAAAAGGRRALRVAVPLAATVWAYDLWAQRNAAGPAFMAAARGLDVLLGAGGNAKAAALPALAVATHTAGVTTLSRGEVHGASRSAVSAALAGTATATAMATLSAASTARRPAPGRPAAHGGPAMGPHGALEAVGGAVPALRTPGRPAAASGAVTGLRGGPARSAGVGGSVPVPPGGGAVAPKPVGGTVPALRAVSRPAAGGAGGTGVRVAVAAAGDGAATGLRGALAALRGGPVAHGGAATGVRAALAALRAGAATASGSARSAGVGASVSPASGPPGGGAAALGAVEATGGAVPALRTPGRPAGAGGSATAVAGPSGRGVAALGRTTGPPGGSAAVPPR
ncbi:UbiA family prenyltransferase, partial [Streptomyces mayteni]